MIKWSRNTAAALVILFKSVNLSLSVCVQYLKINFLVVITYVFVFSRRRIILIFYRNFSAFRFIFSCNNSADLFV